MMHRREATTTSWSAAEAEFELLIASASYRRARTSARASRLLDRKVDAGLAQQHPAKIRDLDPRLEATRLSVKGRVFATLDMTVVTLQQAEP